MMLELESLATVGALEATEDGGLIMGDQVALQHTIYFEDRFRAKQSKSKYINSSLSGLPVDQRQRQVGSWKGDLRRLS